MAIIMSLLLAAFAHFLSSIAITFLDPAALARRYAVLFLILPCLVLAVQNVSASFIGELFAMYMVGFGLHAHYFLCLMRIASPQQTDSGADLDPFARWLWACQSLFTPRREIPSAHTAKTDEIRRSRGKFLLKHCWKMLWTTSIYLFLENTPLLPLLLGETPDFSPQKQPLLTRLHDTTASDLITRTYISARGILISYVSLSGAHSLCALTSVAILGASPEEWQIPLFGPIHSAWSLRRWYATFWHKLMRKGFTTNASWVTHDCLRIPRGTVAGRIVILLLCFTMSGAMHTVAAWPGSGQCAHSRPLMYNVAFATAIIAEDLVRRVYLRGMKEAGIGRSRWVRLMERAVGYCWVALWFLEALPRTLYPGINCAMTGVAT